MEKKIIKGTLYCALPEGLSTETVMNAYEDFLDQTGEDVNFEGFANGFAYAVACIHACAQEVLDEESDCDLKA